VVFFAISWAWPASRQLFASNLPPLFVRWHPLVGPLLAVPVALGIGLWLFLPRLMRMRTLGFVLVLVLFAWVFAETLAMQAGQARKFNRCCVVSGYAASLTSVLQRPDDYFHDVSLVQAMGARNFAQRYPDIASADTTALSIHSATHPPGAALLEWALWRLSGRSLLAVAMALAMIGAFGVVVVRALALELYGLESSRIAAVLFATAPGVLLYSATSADAIFMTVTGLALMALVRAPRSSSWAFAAGGLAALALMFTWGALALAPIGLGVALISLRRWPAILIARRALAVLIGLVFGWAALLLITGVNLVADLGPAAHHQITFVSHQRSYWYWLGGNVFAFLFVAGAWNCGSLVAITAARWRSRRPGMETVLWATLALTTLTGEFKGETDHNWLFLMPLAIAVAAAGRSADRLRGAVGAGLGQAGLTEALFYTAW
jgi:methylthioxylose transferase